MTHRPALLPALIVAVGLAAWFGPSASTGPPVSAQPVPARIGAGLGLGTLSCLFARPVSRQLDLRLEELDLDVPRLLPLSPPVRAHHDGVRFSLRPHSSTNGGFLWLGRRLRAPLRWSDGRCLAPPVFKPFDDSSGALHVWVDPRCPEPELEVAGCTPGRLLGRFHITTDRPTICWIRPSCRLFGHRHVRPAVLVPLRPGEERLIELAVR